MSQEKEPTLLKYVIAYLQEEQARNTRRVNQENIKEWVDLRVDEAIDAYTGGAR